MAAGKSAVPATLAFLDVLESDVAGIMATLSDHSGATVVRALSVCERAAAEIASNLCLLRDIEAPRQRATQAARAQREAEAKAEADREAKAKAERVAARRAKQTRIKK